MANKWGKNGNSERSSFLGLQKQSSHEMKRCLLPGRKASTNLDSVLKSRSITLLTKVHIVKAMVFPIVMYRYESWTIKRLNTGELTLSNHGAGEDSRESLGLPGKQTNQS